MTVDFSENIIFRKRWGGIPHQSNTPGGNGMVHFYDYTFQGEFRINNTLFY